VTFVAYGVSALAVLPILIIAGQPLIGFSAQAWLLILGVTLGAQLLGHTLMSKVLKTTSATVVSLAILLEMPGATLIAAVWLGQVPPLALYPAAALIFAGLFVVIRASAPRDALVESPPV
jgi:drug/metabolite transporter (DMT)-like permease